MKGKGIFLGKLADMVDYQQHTIVSRQILKNSHGSVTVFCFDEGEDLSEHTAPYDALLYVLEGTTRVRVGGVPYDLAEGDALLMPAGVPHAVEGIDGFKILLVMIKKEDDEDET